MKRMVATAPMMTITITMIDSVGSVPLVVVFVLVPGIVYEFVVVVSVVSVTAFTVTTALSLIQ